MTAYFRDEICVYTVSKNISVLCHQVTGYIKEIDFGQSFDMFGIITWIIISSNSPMNTCVLLGFTKVIMPNMSTQYLFNSLTTKTKTDDKIFVCKFSKQC